MKKIIAVMVAIVLLLLTSLCVVAETPVAIKTESDLKAISAKGNYYLANDITLSGEFSPLETFSGEFDGRGKKIINLTINVSATTSETIYGGLFKKIDGGQVHDLTLEKAKITVSGGKNVYLGAVCGKVVSGKVSNCRVSGEISVSAESGTAYVGGIVGSNGAQVQLCENLVNITVSAGHVLVGGILGEQTRSDYIIEKCVNKGNVTVTDKGDLGNVGGIVGKTVGNVENCANYGAVSLSASGYGYVGGIAANIGGDVNNCFDGGKLVCNAKTDGYVDPIAAKIGENKAKNNYYLDTVIEGLITTDVKTASELEDRLISNLSVFSEFDFDTVWEMTNGGPVIKGITAAQITPETLESETVSSESKLESAISSSTDSAVEESTDQSSGQTESAESQTVSDVVNSQTLSEKTESKQYFWILIGGLAVLLSAAAVCVVIWQKKKSEK